MQYLLDVKCLVAFVYSGGIALRIALGNQYTDKQKITNNLKDLFESLLPIGQIHDYIFHFN